MREREKASLFLDKWVERTHGAMGADTHRCLIDAAIHLYKIEALPSNRARGFALAKWKRIGHLLTECVCAVERGCQKDLRFACRTIRKITSDITCEWRRCFKEEHLQQSGAESAHERRSE